MALFLVENYHQTQDSTELQVFYFKCGPRTTKYSRLIDLPVLQGIRSQQERSLKESTYITHNLRRQKPPQLRG